VCAAPAQADLLTPDQLFRVGFVLPITPFPFGTPDTLIFAVDVTRLEPFGSLSVSLFDGHDLLGTYSTSVNGTTSGGGLGLNGYFLSPTSTYGVSPGYPQLDVFGPPALIDFTSLADRSIQGTIELWIASGAVDVRRDTVRLYLGRSTPRGSVQWRADTQPIITSTAITPEPATLFLVAGSVALLARRRWRDSMGRQSSRR
jgi:hypothetical protein